jgi:hypothetical protein
MPDPLQASQRSSRQPCRTYSLAAVVLPVRCRMAESSRQILDPGQGLSAAREPLASSTRSNLSPIVGTAFASRCRASLEKFFDAPMTQVTQNRVCVTIESAIRKKHDAAAFGRRCVIVLFR